MADRSKAPPPMLDRRGTLGLAAAVAAFGAALGMNVAPARADPSQQQYKFNSNSQLKSGGSQFKSGSSQFKSGTSQFKAGSSQLKFNAPR